MRYTAWFCCPIISPLRALIRRAHKQGVNGMEEEFLFCISVSVFLCIFGSKSREQSEDSFSYIVQNFKALKGVNSSAG